VKLDPVLCISHQAHFLPMCSYLWVCHYQPTLPEPNIYQKGWSLPECSPIWYCVISTGSQPPKYRLEWDTVENTLAYYATIYSTATKSLELLFSYLFLFW